MLRNTTFYAYNVRIPPGGIPHYAYIYIRIIDLWTSQGPTEKKIHDTDVVREGLTNQPTYYFFFPGHRDTASTDHSRPGSARGAADSGDINY